MAGRAAARPINDQVLAITHVTIIDCTGNASQRDMTVLVANGRIAAIGRSANLKVPPGIKVVEGAGKFLTPGMWDMHTHSGGYENGKKYFSSLAANGITGVRDMGTSLDDILRLRKEAAEGRILGPRMIVSGPLLQGPLPPKLAGMALLLSLHDESQARAVVIGRKAKGVDFIKVHDSLPRNIYFAIARAAEEASIPFAGHVPPSISAEEASIAGQRSIEHLGGRYYALLLDCSSHQTALTDQLRKTFNEAKQAVFNDQEPDDSVLFRSPLLDLLVATFSEEKAAKLFALFVRNQTWQVPTLVALKTLWSGQSKKLSPQDLESNRRLFEKDLEVVGAMHRAGVRIMAGTDSSPAEEPPMLREELKLLVRAGLTPLEALQAATRNPAQFLGRLDQLGTVEQGKVADLVVLEANPLDDIANVSKVSSVVFAGRLMTGAEIQSLQAEPGNVRAPQSPRRSNPCPPPRRARACGGGW
jgi:imidazolonepropionase-like amidohydrolase